MRCSLAWKTSAIGIALGSDVPNPARAVAEHDPALGLVEAASLGFAPDAQGKGGRCGIGVAAGSALDRGRVAGRAWIAHGAAGLGIAGWAVQTTTRLPSRVLAETRLKEESRGNQPPSQAGQL